MTTTGEAGHKGTGPVEQPEASAARFRCLFEEASDGLLVLDAETGRVEEANGRAADILGCPRADMLGRQLSAIGLLADDGANQAALEAVRERGVVHYDHLPLETRDGRRVDVELVASACREDGRLLALCNLRDITERRRAEGARVQAEALADLHRRKDEFLATLSHEFRNPLAAIMNAVHLLRLRQAEHPLQAQARTIIERQVGHLSILLNDLLEVSRVTTGRIRLRPAPVDLRDVVGRAADSVRALMTQHQHEFEAALPPDPLWVFADATRIEQVIVNLLHNAIKYTHDGGRVWLAAAAEDGAAVVRVRDTGIGIDPQFLPRIFDLFNQAERRLDPSKGGLGVGLTLAHYLVEKHHGTIQVASTPGQGSEFVVRLPALRDPAAPESAALAPKPPGGPLRVLIVDDNRDMAESSAALLRELGHELRVAHAGRDGLAAALDFLPHVVLLNIGLPDQSGHEVARRMRQYPQLKDARLIAVTGYGQDADRDRSRAAGIDLHLVKPVDHQVLQDILEALARQAGQGGPPAAAAPPGAAI